VVGLALADQPRIRRGIVVAGPDPERDRELGADAAAGALVIGMCVGERVGGDGPASELLEDAPALVAGGGVDQDVFDQIDVDRVRREAAELPDAVCELLHGFSLLGAKKARARSATSSGRSSAMK